MRRLRLGRVTVIRDNCGAHSYTNLILGRNGKPYRRGVCNRPVGHTGPHREYNKRDFRIRGEW